MEQEGSSSDHPPVNKRPRRPNAGTLPTRYSENDYLNKYLIPERFLRSKKKEGLYMIIGCFY